MGKRPLRFGIRVQFVLTVSALLILTCLTLIVLFIHHEKRTSEILLADHGKSLARSLALQVRDAVSRSRLDTLQAVLNGFMERENLVYCTVRDGQGRIVAGGKGEEDTDESERVMIFSQTVSNPGVEAENPAQKPWTVSIGLSLSPWTRRLASLRRTGVLLTLLLVAVGVLAALMVVHRTMRPFRVLLDATQRIARGEFDKPVQVMSNSEIRELSEALNEMAFKLQQSHAQLEEYSRTLERKVEERTEELEKRVRELSDSRMATLNILEDVKEAKTELEKVNAELRALDEMKSKFIGTISHELKTPFTAIKANIDFILSGKEGRVPENLNRYLLAIQRNTNRVRKIMEDLLTVAQIHSGRRHLEPENIKLEPVVREYLAEIGPLDEKFKVEVDIPGNIVVFADPNRLHDIYVNLLLNAIKFSPDGGNIRITARPYDGQILCGVSDQGVGIPADKLSHIFDAFFQIDRKRYGGTGLGLSIVKGIIQEHGGRIWVDSRPGEGSTFFFTLPAGRDTKNEAIG